jgi:transcriptional regulator of acetoin/glycerol metabolism
MSASTTVGRDARRIDPMGKPQFSIRDLLAAGARRESAGSGSRAFEVERETPYSHGETSDAWERFLTTSDANAEVHVRGIIEQSWRRSAKFGVDARGRGSTSVMAPSDIDVLRFENEDLLASARQTFLRVAETLSDAGTMAIITDFRGVILEVGGDRKTIDAAHNIRLEIGAAWDEQDTGTNGIGTALATGQMTVVNAHEHFCEGVKAWACVGAPIISPIDGRILGVVDFSGPHDIFQRHNIALAMVSAKHIELALTEKIRTERMQLLETSLGKIPRVGISDGIVIVDRFGQVIHHDQTAASNLRRMSAIDRLEKGDRILDLDGSTSGFDLAERLPTELKNHDVLPLTMDGKIRGAMLVIGPRQRSASETIARTSSAARLTRVPEIIGQSPAILEAIDRTERAAQGRTAILIEGETGVGKELFARHVHKVAFPSEKEPFVAFNCGAVSKELIGGELFGHAAGAFTGATRDGRAGRFEAASGGTLSLDEIGEMPLDLQPYLLRALEEEVIYRLGESKGRPVNVRLVASTNRNLRSDVDEGRFRKDLYFRISAIKITIPPLRDRLDDFELLLDHFNRRLADKYTIAPLTLAPEAMDILRRYSWPGNVRELRNLVESAMFMTKGSILRVCELPDDILRATTSDRTALGPDKTSSRSFPTDEGDHEGRTLAVSERHMIERAMQETAGNIKVVAQRLGVSVSTIYRKLSQYKSGK